MKFIIALIADGFRFDPASDAKMTMRGTQAPVFSLGA